MPAASEAIDLDTDWIAGFAVNVHLWICAWRASRPVHACFKAWLLVGWRTRKIDLVRRPATQSLVRAMLIVPVDDQATLVLKSLLIFRNYNQSQDVFHRSMESFHDRDRTVLVHRAEARKDVPGFAPLVLEMMACELGPLVDNQVLWFTSIRCDDIVQRCRYFS